MLRITMLAIVAVLALQTQDSLAGPVDKLRQAIEAFRALQAQVDALEAEVADQQTQIDTIELTPGPEGPEGPPGPPGVDTLGNIAGCLAGDIIEFDGSVWECVPRARPPPTKTVFVTASIYNGDLKTAGGGADGLEGADNLCQLHADVGIVPPGEYIAWLSTSTVHARDRLPANDGGWVLADGATIIATSKADLLDGAIGSPISQDEFGRRSPWRAWTGTTPTGFWSAIDGECADWTLAALGPETGLIGDSQVQDASWTSLGPAPCEGGLQHGALYCFER